MNRLQGGFALVFSMMVLAILTAIVIGSVRSTVSGERASGSHMDRTAAFQAAEQALIQGKSLLMENADTCLTGCAIASDKSASASTAQTAFASVNAWSDANKIDATLASGQNGSAAYRIVQLSSGSLTSPATGTARSDCIPYSVMGRGVGVAGGVVVLQTVVWVCPV
ncbi:pilus assembly PilX family protein [Azonexus fungiphilus]|uniref:pilus assembly PilX family protein n=1 Tax=Azonexus fungiphilus TaxID=146940 RepID=UPI001473CC7F|nr:PilX N-terminal domain-containing pilus assembly protein [Azonexus fungiphilus]